MCKGWEIDGKNECAEWLLQQVGGWCRMNVQGVEEAWTPSGLQVDPLTAGWEQRAVPE